MAYDDVISHIGEFGRYQRRTYFLLCLPAISCAFHKMGGVFLAAQPDFRCLLPNENPDNASFLLPSDVANLNYPWDYETKRWSQCERYDIDLADQHNGSNSNENSSWSPPIVKCNSFVYDRHQYTTTITTEWNLVCDDAWLRVTGDSVFMVGLMIGSIIFGGLSDKYGRKVTLFLALTGQLIAGILVAVSPEIITYLISKMILASMTGGVYLLSYIIALEMVGPKKRLMAGTGYYLINTLGYILIAGFAYFITSWRALHIAFTVPSIACLAYWWFIPESGRWLLSKGRLQEATDLLRKAASENGAELSKDTMDGLLGNDSESGTEREESSVFDLIRYPHLRKKCLLLILTWFANSSTYYGLSWNTSNLGGNNYVNFAIAAAVEVPAHLFQFFLLDRWGRKIIVCGCMLFAGISLLCTLIVPNDMEWMVVVLAMFGKFAITASYDAVYIFAAEQFPTVVRSVGLGACSTCARIGSILAPYIIHLAEVWTPLPYIILGSFSLMAGFLSLLLPETLNTKLPESIEDSVRLEKKLRGEIEQFKNLDTIQPLTTKKKAPNV